MADQANMMRPKKVNFSELEKNLLCDLIQRNKHIIECKKTDACTKEKKLRAWQNVTRDFNCAPGVRLRTVEQLKKCWDNLKTKSKKELCKETRQFFTTGESWTLYLKNSSMTVLFCAA